jgi:hypothetical protein
LLKKEVMSNIATSEPCHSDMSRKLNEFGGGAKGLDVP